MADGTDPKVVPLATASSDGELQRLVRRQLELLGEDPDREGLDQTPVRVESSLRWLTRGYRESVEEIVRGAVFEESHDSMVLVGCTGHRDTG